MRDSGSKACAKWSALTAAIASRRTAGSRSARPLITSTKLRLKKSCRDAVAVRVDRLVSVAPLDVVLEPVPIDVGVEAVGDAVAVGITVLLGVLHTIAVGVGVEEVG